MQNKPKDGNILIGLPGEPEELALAIVKRTVNWISANKGIEMTYYQGEEMGHSMIFLEALRPDEWKEDDMKNFVGFIGHVAMKMRDQLMDDEGEEWKSSV